MKVPVVLAFYSVSVVVSGDVLDKYIRQASGPPYHGRYTRNVHEAKFLIPRRVHADGSFKSFELPNYYAWPEERINRDKRSAVLANGLANDTLHLVLPFDGSDHHVELRPYHGFISPEMVVEIRGGGIGTDLNEALRFQKPSDRQCHYRGTVRGHDNSRATLSLCNGVAGYLQTNQGRYFIEPAHNAEPEVDGQHVHIVYRREAPQESYGSVKTTPNRRCGTSDDWESAWAEQLAKRQKRLAESGALDEKRSAPVSSGTHSIHRFIEVGLVADRRFLDFHKDTDYEQYLLTVMNMVSDYYHDSSVGNQIDVVVVRMIYLEKEKEEIDLLITPAAESTLDSFAKWAEKMNPKDHNHPNHYDVAALVTRYDICSEGTNCDLMGLAFVAAACDPPKAASINEDSGLLLGIVLAHEIGHVMGCSHDEPETSGCPSQDSTDGSFYLLSPFVFLYTIRWSPCSRKYITDFLESGLGDCLNDDPRSPSNKFKYPNMLPGAMYGADFQCKMTFPESSICTHAPAGDCENLWCFANSSCYTLGSPMADGTKCGENKWCIHKKCVDMGSRPAAVNGGWGSWGPMGSCSRTCGGGLKISERECNKPLPVNGGKYCTGERKRIAICNTTPCDPTKPPFRAVQCSKHDGDPVLSDGLHKWRPYTTPDLEPCALYCINEKNTFVKIAPSVNDSTPCKPGTNDMCIAGNCRKVGCDWVLDSTAIEDKCGVCKGDGTKCRPIDGDYSETVTSSSYFKIVTIPKGARNINAFEKKPSKNTLAIKLEKKNTYCLNGNNHEQRSGDYECAGTSIVYTHPEPEKEEVNMKGPITEDIQLQYAFYDPRDNPGVHYTYYVLSTNSSYKPKYTWDFVEWSVCNAKCGGGTMSSEAQCVEEKGGKVTANFCDGLPRPETRTRVCNNKPCRPRWRVSQWSNCNACDGKKGERRRKVQCVKPGAHPGEDDVQTDLKTCKGRTPRQKEPCKGTRPCKKTCSKKTRSSVYDLAENPMAGEAEVLREERRAINERYSDRNIDGHFKRARNVSSAEESCSANGTGIGCEKVFTTQKPGSIIKDSIPVKTIILKEAPFMEEFLPSNLSDQAYREAGDLVGSGIDTTREKIYRGAQAVKMIDQLEHKNYSANFPPPIASIQKDNSSSVY